MRDCADHRHPPPCRHRRGVEPGTVRGNQTRQPTFVRYDPERRYAEVDDDGFLLFTLDSSIPMIRYRINDQGAVFSARPCEAS